MSGIVEGAFERELANGARTSANGFTGGVPNIDADFFEVGDTFTLKEKYANNEILEREFGKNVAQYVLVEVTRANGTKVVIPFYPSTFTKRRTVANADGTLTKQRVHTLGTAAEEYRKHVNKKEAMEALGGKKLKISEISVYKALRYGTSEVVDTSILTIDFAEESK